MNNTFTLQSRNNDSAYSYISLTICSTQSTLQSTGVILWMTYSNMESGVHDLFSEEGNGSSSNVLVSSIWNENFPLHWISHMCRPRCWSKSGQGGNQSLGAALKYVFKTRMLPSPLCSPKVNVRHVWSAFLNHKPLGQERNKFMSQVSFATCFWIYKSQGTSCNYSFKSKI